MLAKQTGSGPFLYHLYDDRGPDVLGGLGKELEKLNQLAWQADEDIILDWAIRRDIWQTEP